jgi:uncharacterized cupin superfamily protein
MTPQKRFSVFGDPVEVVVSSQATNGAFCSIIQTTMPGGGPPPHVHEREDELFLALDPGLELFNGKEWLPLQPGTPQYSLRGQLHAFRNSGTAPARILVVATPGSLDEYLEEISIVNMPADEQLLYRISDAFGITFPLMNRPALQETSAELVSA